jgi:putative OPT family oligopeptide transporter
MGGPDIPPGNRLFPLLVGFLISVVLGSALVIPALKAGITPGVSPLVVLFCWVLFGAVLGPRLKSFLAVAQVTGSGGAAVTAGVVFTAPILQILAFELGGEAEVDVWMLMLASVSGALLGFGFVGFATKRFLSDPRLPAPEAVACDRLIETAVENPTERPRLTPSLFGGLLSGAAVAALIEFAWLKDHVCTFAARMFSNVTGGPGVTMTTADEPHPSLDFQVPIPVSPVYIGIGALLTLPTAILIFGGGLLNSGTNAYATANGMPDTTFRWVGGAAMTVAVLYSLAAYVLEGRRKKAEDEAAAVLGASPELAAAAADETLLEQSAGVKRALWLSIAAGTALMLMMLARLGASTTTLVVMGAVTFVLVSLLSGLGGLLSLQVGSSASPVSGTVFMGMLVLSLTGLGIGLEGMTGVAMLVPLVVAACVAICAANDSSQDYKTMQLNGFRVSGGFGGQLVGLLGGAIAVPLTLKIAHDAYQLGSESLPAPQASFFSTVLKSLFLDAEIPWGPVGVGALFGVGAVLLDAWGKRRGYTLSSLAFAVGIYLPSTIGTGIMLGAAARFLATRRIAATTHQGILAAAGIITGDALFALVYGLLIVGQVSTEGAHAAADYVPTTLTAGIALAVLLALVFGNYLVKGRTERD